MNKRHAGRTLATMAVAGLLAACATPLDAPIRGYLCCNLQNDYGWIYSSNYLGGVQVPLGQPVSLTTVKRSTYVYGTVGDASFGFGYQGEGKQVGTLAWVRTLVVPEDPSVKLEAFPAAVRAAILSSRVAKGMTREQVMMSLGPPTPDGSQHNPSVWRYWTRLDDEPVDLTFDASGVLVQVQGSAGGLKLVEIPRLASPQ